MIRVVLMLVVMTCALAELAEQPGSAGARGQAAADNAEAAGVLEAVGESEANRGPETVDFGGPPPEGLLISRLRTTVSSLSGRRVVGEAGDRRTQILRQLLTYTENYTERILKVEDGKVTELTRKYVQADTAAEVETDRMTRPRKDFREEPFAAVDLHVEWIDGKPELQVIVPPDERQETSNPEILVKPSEAMALALSCAFEHPHPFLPRSPARRAVGSTWKVEESLLDRYFPRKPAYPVKGSLEVTFKAIHSEHHVWVGIVEMPESELDLRTEVEESEEVPTRCAVLTVKGTITTAPKGGRLPLEITLKGTLLYSLEHRLVVHAKLSGRQKIHGTAQGNRFEFEGPYTDTAVACLHRVKPAPGGGEEGPKKKRENE